MFYAIKDIFHKIRHIYNKKQKILFCFLFVAIVISGCLELFGISLVAPFINIVLNPDIIQTNKILKSIYDFLNINWPHVFLIYLAIFLILTYIFKNVYLAVVYYFQYKIFYDAQKEISSYLISFYLNQPYAYHLNLNSSTLVRTITRDTLNCSHFLVNLFSLFTELIVLSLIVIFLFFINKIMTISLIIFFLLSFFVVFRKLKAKLKQIGLKSQQSESLMIKSIQQAFGAIKDIKCLQAEKFFIDKYYENISNFSSAQKQFNFLQSVPRLFIESFVVILILLIIIFLLNSGINATNIITQIAVFAMAAFRLMPSLNRIQIAVTCLIFYRPSLNVVYNDLNLTKIDEQTTEEGKEIVLSKGIKVQDISYKYPNTQRDILKNISFDIKEGQSIGFVGKTGSGKTTLIDIILGLLKPTDGKITVDNINIHNNKKSWSKIIGYVPQFIYLTDDTIKNNILFYSNKDIDEQLFKQVTEQAQLKDFIDSLPDKENTIVGERGIRLSGGQRQRIGIARALYNKPQLLILDEATSALDNETESAVMQAIEHLYGKLTMIIVAHRLTTIEKCDRIYKIQDSKLIIEK